MGHHDVWVVLDGGPRDPMDAALEMVQLYDEANGIAGAWMDQSSKSEPGERMNLREGRHTTLKAMREHTEKSSREEAYKLALELLRASAQNRRHPEPPEDLLREAARAGVDLMDTPGIDIIPRSVIGRRTALEINGTPGNGIFLVFSFRPGGAAGVTPAGVMAQAVVSLSGQKYEGKWLDSSILPRGTLRYWAQRAGEAPSAPQDPPARPSLPLREDWIRNRLTTMIGERSVGEMDNAHMKPLREAFQQAWERNGMDGRLSEVFSEAWDNWISGMCRW